PKATSYVVYGDNIPYTAENKIKLNILKNILDIRYTDSVREKEGGTYGVGVMGWLEKLPVSKYVLLMAFDCDPEKVNHLVPIIYKEVNNIAVKGPKADDLDKVIKNMRKERAEELRQNSFWLDALFSYYWNKENIVSPASFDVILDKIKASDIQSFARTIQNGKSHLKVTFRPQTAN
ncbi:MAG: DUF2875 family protein, partial [Bacteroidota bacterium]|nr:DUF2875 family protein [Bacteroidota bacterium]